MPLIRTSLFSVCGVWSKHRASLKLFGGLRRRKDTGASTMPWGSKRRFTKWQVFLSSVFGC